MPTNVPTNNPGKAGSAGSEDVSAPVEAVAAEQHRQPPKAAPAANQHRPKQPPRRRRPGHSRRATRMAVTDAGGRRQFRRLIVSSVEGFQSRRGFRAVLLILQYATLQSGHQVYADGGRKQPKVGLRHRHLLVPHMTGREAKGRHQ